MFSEKIYLRKVREKSGKNGSLALCFEFLVAMAVFKQYYFQT